MFSESARALAKERFVDAIRDFGQNRVAVFGLAVIVVMVILSVYPQGFVVRDPYYMEFDQSQLPPSWEHPFGTDNFGRDVFSRVIYGARVSLSVGIIAVGLAISIGVPLGLISGFFSGIVDDVIMRVIDGIMAFPAIILALVVVAILGTGLTNTMIAIGVVYIPIFARITRASVLTVRENKYITAAEASGARKRRIIISHVLPNAFSPIIVQATLSFAFAILDEAAISFLGLGAQPPTISWGVMLNEGRGLLEQAPWIATFPGIAIMIAVLGYNLFGDGIRDFMDPHKVIRG